MEVDPHIQATNWARWQEARKAYHQTYYITGMSAADQGYALAGLERFALTWQELHGGKQTPQRILDQACAAEIYYHHYRSREFRRPVAALSACFVALITDRPERIIDRQARDEAKHRKAMQMRREKAV